MALIKTKTLSNGVSFDYHKIISIQYEDGLTSLVKIASFLNKEAREAKKEPIEITVVHLSTPDKTNLIGSAYASLKQSAKVLSAFSPERKEIIPAILNEDGTIAVEEKVNIIPAVTEEVETNFFADALDA
jgi:hypothetical protein